MTPWAVRLLLGIGITVILAVLFVIGSLLQVGLRYGDDESEDRE